MYHPLAAPNTPIEQLVRLIESKFMPLVVLELASVVSIVDAATSIVLGKRESLARGTHCTIALMKKR
jgi:hypothetical protein